MHELLVKEGHWVGVTLVKTAVAEWRRRQREVFIPLTYRPGDLAEVDFFEVLVGVDGVRHKAGLPAAGRTRRSRPSPPAAGSNVRSLRPHREAFSGHAWKIIVAISGAVYKPSVADRER